MSPKTPEEIALNSWRALPHHPVRRAAIIVGVCQNSIWTLLRRGELVPRRLGSRTMVDTASLVRLVDGAPVRSRSQREEPVHV
ncbi:hypothetical protein SAMN02982931_00201 [Bauldia litoralis]|uniref:Helix-turn-helix domain-containing protein n=1 Tax=Bauldia litoralis TaxID=665467 RepID=A0A1G6A5L1_9HYPH|nr:hypothetical protein SAMN02982931_00201 [Bauldia litoralis]